MADEGIGASFQVVIQVRIEPVRVAQILWDALVEESKSRWNSAARWRAVMD
jgi:hypothetical protein